MNRFWKAVGKSAVYFSVYFFSQLLCAVLVSLVLIFFRAVGGYSLDPQLLEEQLFSMMGEILLISNLLCIAVYWLTAKLRRRSFRDHVALYPIKPGAILPLLLLGILLNLTVSAALEVLPIPESVSAAFEEAAAPLSGISPLMMLLSASLVGPVSEELLFRGLIYTRLNKAMPVLPAALLSSLLFGLAHGSLLWFVYTSLLGLLLVWCLHRFRSLWASILLHIGFNFANIPLALLPVESTASKVAALAVGLTGSALLMLLLSRLSRRPAAQ